MKSPQSKIWISTVSIAALLAGGYFLLKKSPLQNSAGADAATTSAGESASTADGTAVTTPDATTHQDRAAGANQGAAASGTTTATTAKTPAATEVTGAVAEKAVTPETQCFVASFTHKKLPTHDDPETCQRHKNIIKLDHSLGEMKNICVRIDGEAVEYQKIKNEPKQIMILGGAGPESKISVRYCIGNRPCPQDCKIQKRKDNFMEAVGGHAQARAKDGDESPAKVMEWDPEKTNQQDKKLIQAVAKEIEGFQEDLKNDADERNEIFTSWIGNDAEISACSAASTAHLNQ